MDSALITVILCHLTRKIVYVIEYTYFIFRWQPSMARRSILSASERDIPDKAQRFIDQATTLLPHVKITELLLEVDN